MKVIYHIDEREKWSLCLGNVENMKAYYRSHHIPYQIEVLANSLAVKDYVKDSALALKLKELSCQGIQFAACHNALRGQKIALEDLLEEVVVVDAGVVELALKQSQGFAYIKP
ncbi:DsrE family protein [Candidatus Stoquefichus sp. SB1]|uniref:DsrE family protein n=1 Tax=Candidatus Stoquefichus sp. SB1 TaxID=1658109 RepID=UPI00067F4369|nr:DsrE family protein [Candidatus Stoquefichus sp. SB1]